MTTYINKIVLLTRRMNFLDSPDTGTEWQRLQDERGELTLTAIRDGVKPDLIQWAIAMNDSAAKVQVQHAIVHLAAAMALEASE